MQPELNRRLDFERRRRERRAQLRRQHRGLPLRSWMLMALPLALLLLTSPVPAPAERALPEAPTLPTAGIGVAVAPARPFAAEQAALPGGRSTRAATGQGGAPIPTLLPTSSAAEALPPGTTRYVPILMYHYIRAVDAAADPLGYNLSVTQEQFAAQLDWLAANGYQTIRMDRAARCLSGQEGCPLRPVVLTFDDGYMDAYTAALPLLQQRSMVGTFYIVNSFIGQPGYMGWNELRTLRDAGMEIGAHSINHPNLTTLDYQSIMAEVANSGRQLAGELQIPIVSFCYPAGRFDATTMEITRQAGYTNATTTVQSWDQNDMMALSRLRIYGELDLGGFAWLVQSYTP